MLSDPDRIRADVVHALAHPMRFRILDVSTRDPGQPLSALTLFPTLAREFADLSLGQVGYHLVQLQKTGLLPT